MRHDLFSGRKSVHVKLEKELHASLRTKLFNYGLTMQDLFQEAAELIVLDTPSAERVIQRVAKKKIKRQLEKVKTNFQLHIGELDSDTLYSLLENSDDDKDNTER